MLNLKNNKNGSIILSSRKIVFYLGGIHEAGKDSNTSRKSCNLKNEK